MLEEPAIYQIRVQGALDASWSDRLGGMTIAVALEPDTPTVTTLTGVIPDQPALEEILTTLYNLGLPLVSVEYLAKAAAN